MTLQPTKMLLGFEVRLVVQGPAGPVDANVIAIERETGKVLIDMDRLICRMGEEFRDTSQRDALRALASWVRGYAMRHDFKEYPQELMDAEDILYAEDAGYTSASGREG